MARTLGPGSLTIGSPGSTREWGGDLTKTSLTPNTKSDDDIPLLSGATLPGEDTTDWALEGTLVDSFDYASLQNFCLANAGKELPFVWTPNTASGGSDYAGVVRIRPIGIGGEVKKKNTNDFSFPLNGDPTVTKRA